MVRRWVEAAKPIAKGLLPFSVRAWARRRQWLYRESGARSFLPTIRRPSFLRFLPRLRLRGLSFFRSAAPALASASPAPVVAHPQAAAAPNEPRTAAERIAALESELARTRAEHDAIRRELQFLRTAEPWVARGRAMRQGLNRILTISGRLRTHRVRLDAPHPRLGQRPLTADLQARRLAPDAAQDADAGVDANPLPGRIRVSDTLADAVDIRGLDGWRLERRRGAAIVELRASNAAESVDGGRTLALVDSRTFAIAWDALARAGTPCAVWFGADEPRRPYELRVELRRAAMLGISNDPAQTRRLELLGIPAAHAKTMTEAARLAIAASAGPQRAAATTTMTTIAAPTRSDRERPIPILLQVDDFLQGGLEQVVLDMGQALGQRGFAPRLLILGRQGRAADDARAMGLPILTLPATRERERETAYRRLLESEGIRAVLAQYSTFGAEIAAKAGARFVQVIHNCYVWLDKSQANRFRRADRATSRTICVSPEAACYSDIVLGLDAAKMTIIPNSSKIQTPSGDQDQNRLRVRREVNAGPRDFVFLSAASVYGPKAQLPLVRAFAEVAARRPTARLAMAGGEFDPGYARRVRDEIQSLGLKDRAFLLGHRRDVPALHRAADAFVMPSVWEGWSMALNEAMAAGLPVAATNVGSARDVLEPGTDILIPAAFTSICDVNGANCGHWIDSEWHRIEPDLVDAMIRLIDRPRRRDPARFAAESSVADVDRMYDHYARVVTQLLDRGS